ncbi:MAG: hypothetical protein PHS96_00940 [Anaerolineales bacterium]|nr:hypothetical protein [Anaerolineales bacterium]
MSGEAEAEMIAGQLRAAVGLLQAELGRLERELEHQAQFNRHRLDSLEAAVKDHEQRIRAATDGVTQFKVWSGLATGGSWLVSAFALLRSWFVG